MAEPQLLKTIMPVLGEVSTAQGAKPPAHGAEQVAGEISRTEGEAPPIPIRSSATTKTTAYDPVIAPERKAFTSDIVLEYIHRLGVKAEPRFQVDAENEAVLRKLALYFTQHPDAGKLGLSLRKGILLSGPIGCGKTLVMRLFARNALCRYHVVSARQVAHDFSYNGFRNLERYARLSFHRRSSGIADILDLERPTHYCFDDLGEESRMKFYGNECEVMAEILLTRYDLLHTGMKTFATTRFLMKDLETMYGGYRMRSRMREMFNLVSFPSTAKDRRV